jgi:hypothetical protein
MAAIMFAAAFAGIMLAVDESDAAGEEVVEYTITYSYDGLVSSEKTSGGSIANVKAFATALPDADLPDGYQFKHWVSGASAYAAGSPATFTADATLTPVFEVANGKAIIIIVDGDRSEKIVLGTTTSAESSTPVVDPISKEQVSTALTALGVKFTIADADETVAIEKTGFKFEGFQIRESGEGMYSYKYSDLVGVAEKEAVYNIVYTPVFEVSFFVEGASVLETTSDRIIITGQVASGDIPKAPSKANYLFMGWYNAAGEPVFTYSADLGQYSVSTEDFKITEGTTLYAKFVPVTFTVTFVYGEDKTVFTTETVKYGDLAIEPKGLPEGYKGWDWNFGTKIIADTEIVAIVADPVTVYTVTFEIDGKAPVTQRSDSMVLPDTNIEGKVFQGWVVKGESQYVSPMSYDITEDITFVAVYKEADPPAGPGFFETTTGQCVAVIIAVVIIALIYAVATNMFGLKDALTSVKITRVKK